MKKKLLLFWRLTAFEIRKAFRNPLLLLLLVGFLILNGFMLRVAYQKDVSFPGATRELYNTFYEKWKGPITPETAGDMMRIFGPLEKKQEEMSLTSRPDPETYTGTDSHDYMFFGRQFAYEMMYDYDYAARSRAWTAESIRLANLALSQGNLPLYRANAASAQNYNGRSIPTFQDTRYLETWLHYDYSVALVLLLILFGLCTVFVTEKESRMYMLQRTAPLGGGATVAAKLTGAALFVLLLSFLFFLEDFLVLRLLSGHSGALNSPCYALRALEHTGLNLTLGQLVLWVSFVKFLGILSCSSLVLLLSCLCRRVLTTFAAGLLTFLALSGIQEMARGRAGLKWFNPIELLLPRELICRQVYVGPLAMPLHSFVILGIGIVTVLAVGGILLLNPGRRGGRAC